jgi:hypothetical protein
MSKNTKQELLDTILAGREKLDDALAKVTDSQMTLAILHAKWTTKDLLGHLAFWEESAATLFTTLRMGQEPEPFPALDELNARQLAEWRTIPLAEVKTREKAAFERVLELIRSANDTELFDPAHFPFTGGRAYEEFFRDNTCGHYEEHLASLNTWLKRIA